MASFESTLAAIPGYGGYLAKRKMNEEDNGMSDLQKLSTLMTLSEMAQKQKQAASARDATAGYLSSLGAGPDSEAMRTYGQIDPKGLLEKVIKQKMEQAQSDKEFARFGLNQPPIQSPAPQMLTGNEPMAAKSGDMAGLSGFQGNPQALLEQISQSKVSPQDKQMMLSQLQEQMKGVGLSNGTSTSPELPPALANISRDQAILMSGSQDKGVAAIGKMVTSHYEKRDMLDLQGQQRADMLRLAAGLKPDAAPAPISQIRVIDDDPKSPTYGKPVIKDGRTGKTLGLDSGLDVGAQGALAGAKESGQAKAKRAMNMAGLGDVIDEARALLSGSSGKALPTGSGSGAAFDYVASIVGASPEGAKEAQTLKAIGGALTSKMPRMEGPQSDKDTQLYREMAAMIGDATMPRSRRLAALDQVEKLWGKYDQGQPSSAKTTPNSLSLPPPPPGFQVNK